MNTSLVSVMGRLIDLKKIYKIHEVQTQIADNYPTYHSFQISYFGGEGERVSVNTDLYFDTSNKKMYSYKEWQESRVSGKLCTEVPYSIGTGYSNSLDYKEKLDKLEAIRLKLIYLWEKNKLDIVYLEL